MFSLGDWTKVVCDQTRIVGFGMQDRVAPKEQIFLFIRIQRGHIATPQSQLSDESQYIAWVLQCGDLPVVPVATATDNPRYENSSGDGRFESDGSESFTIRENVGTDMYQCMW